MRRKILGSDFVQSPIVRGVHKIRRCRDNMIKAAAYGAQDLLNVFVHLVTLLLDVGRDAAIRSPPNRSRDEHEVSAADPQRVRSDWLRHRSGLHDLLAHERSSPRPTQSPDPPAAAATAESSGRASAVLSWSSASRTWAWD